MMNDMVGHAQLALVVIYPVGKSLITDHFGCFKHGFTA